VTRIIFVRHGSHDLLGRQLCGRMGGVLLNSEGRRQAAAVARRLARETIAAVYSSPLERACETAAPIAAALGLEVQTAGALNEADVGDWTGRAFSELRRTPSRKAWRADRVGACPPGGESAAAVQVRVGTWIQDVAERHRGRTVVAVSHGDVIKSAIAAALGLKLSRLDRFEISAASISVLDASGGGLKVWSVNETSRWPRSARGGRRSHS
jgi:probable phosphoglycerate mutase